MTRFIDHFMYASDIAEVVLNETMDEVIEKQSQPQETIIIIIISDRP